MAFDEASLGDVLDRLLAPVSPRAVKVALSGGLDSTVLLRAAAALAGDGRLPPVAALHVDHGLHPDSGSWARHCAAMCERLGVPLECLRVDAAAAPGESPEAAARAARYAALEPRVGEGEVLLTAHHADDQLETLLLMLLRGSGPAGLAAMPGLRAFGRGHLGRPLLGYTRAELEAWARDRGLAWLEDPANRDPRLDRNWLRRAVLPALRERWPGAALAGARSAALCAEADRLAAALGEQDLAAVSASGRPDAAALLGLGPERARNALRRWISRRGLPQPHKRQLDEAVEGVLAAAPDATPELRWPGGALRRAGGRLHLLEEAQLSRLEGSPPSGPWAAGETFELGPGMGRLRLEAASGGAPGPRLAPAAAEALEVCYRRGGERIRPCGDPHTRGLKQLLQEAGILPWMRERLPLLQAGGRLVAVADLWVAEEAAARPGEPGLRVRWEDRPELV